MTSSDEVAATDPAATDPTPEPETVAEAAIDATDSNVEPDVADETAATADAEELEPDAEVSVETLIADLERVSAERDQYQRVAADYKNFRVQADKRQGETVRQAAASTVERLLPVLDACDGALLQGSTDVVPIHGLLLDTLTSLGLKAIAEVDAPFDPSLHEAVMTEPAADGDDGQIVSEILRTGYTLNGRTLRAAMVKVRG
ncbi:MAG: nucleotide exchange factor GrpE [Acidimicrobiales bacterium]